jgi:hypothetical protein
MFGCRMEEEAKLAFTITVNWHREDGSIATTQLGTLDRGACRSAEDVGLQLADAKPILGRLQEMVVSEQLQRYCEAVRPCPLCHHRRHLKDYRRRRFDTVFGRLAVRAQRFDGCRHCGERRITSPVSELLPERVSPELRHLQAQLAAQLPYRQAAALLEELLPETGGLIMPRHVTERSLSANALKKRSAGKSITPVLSPNRLSKWWWESMAHSLKEGILGRAKGISLRFSPGASRHRSAAARHSPWYGTWIRMQRGACKPFSGAAVEDKTRI